MVSMKGISAARGLASRVGGLFAAIDAVPNLASVALASPPPSGEAPVLGLDGLRINERMD